MLKNNYFNLFLGVPDTDLAKIIGEVQKTGKKHPEIYKMLDQDIDKKALEKKRIRHLDKQYKNRETSFFNNELEEISATEYNPIILEIGCPRISHQKKYYCLFHSRAIGAQ